MWYILYREFVSGGGLRPIPEREESEKKGGGLPDVRRSDSAISGRKLFSAFFQEEM